MALQLSPEGEEDVVREAGPDLANRLVLLAVWLVARQQIRPVLPCTPTNPPHVQEGHRVKQRDCLVLFKQAAQVVARFGVVSKALVLFTQVGQLLERLGVDSKALVPSSLYLVYRVYGAARSGVGLPLLFLSLL